MRRLLDTFSTITAVIAMIVAPPTAGVITYGLWLSFPLPFDMQIPSILAGAWSAFVVAAIIRRGFE